MTPSSRALYDYLRDDGRMDEPEADMEQVDEDPQTRQVMALHLKKKRHQMMLKQMLTDSGYGDLAKMVNVGKESYQVDGDGLD